MEIPARNGVRDDKGGGNDKEASEMNDKKTAAKTAIFYFKKSEIFPKSRIVMNTKKLMKNAAATFWITD